MLASVHISILGVATFFIGMLKPQQLAQIAKVMAMPATMYVYRETMLETYVSPAMPGSKAWLTRTSTAIGYC